MKATYSRDNDYYRYYEHQEKKLNKKFSNAKSKAKSSVLEKAKRGELGSKRMIKSLHRMMEKKFPNNIKKID